MKRIAKVNIERESAKIQKKEDRQRFLYGQAVTGIMKELSLTWADAKKELSKRMKTASLNRELSYIN